MAPDGNENGNENDNEGGNDSRLSRRDIEIWQAQVASSVDSNVADGSNDGIF